MLRKHDHLAKARLCHGLVPVTTLTDSEVKGRQNQSTLLVKYTVEKDMMA